MHIVLKTKFFTNYALLEYVERLFARAYTIAVDRIPLMTFLLLSGV